MYRFRTLFCVAAAFATITVFSQTASAWYDETHIAVAKVAGYKKWYNAAGADMLKLKAAPVEKSNHYTNNPPDTIVTLQTVLAQAAKYNLADNKGHLYGAIIASVREYLSENRTGKYNEYHLAFCAHYVGDLSQPLHNTRYNSFNRKNHQTIETIINESILDNLDKIKIYPITIETEKDLAAEIARIANLSLKLGYRIEREHRLLTNTEAYAQLGHSASLLKAILNYVKRQGMP